MFCNSKSKKGSEKNPWGPNDSAGLLRQRIKFHHRLQMEDSLISSLIEKFGTFSIMKNGIQVCQAPQFKDMIGILGNFFVGERIFEVVLALSKQMENRENDMVQKQQTDRVHNLLPMWRGTMKTNHPDYARNYIILEDYVVYMDMIYYGDEEQKARIGFMMMDVAGKGMIYLEDYRNFWIKFFQMYGELLQTKFNYDEESDEVTKMCFELIAKMGSDAANEED